MEEAKKTRGAWVIHVRGSHVRGSDVKQGTDAGCSPTPNGDEQRNVKDGKEE